MKLSNETIRKRAIWKAVLLTVLPMIFSGGGVYLWCCQFHQCQEKENLDWKGDYENLEKNNKALSSFSEQLNSNWNNYLSFHQKFMNNTDSISREKILVKIEENGKNIINQFSKIPKEIIDTNYLETLTLLEENYDDFFKEMSKLRTFNDTFSKNSDDENCCIDLTDIEIQKDELLQQLAMCNIAKERCESTKGISGEINELCESQKQNLQNQINGLSDSIDKLRDEKKKLGKKYRDKIKSELNSAGVSNKKVAQILQGLDFGL